MDVAPSQSILLLRQNDDAAAFRRLIRKGGQLGRIGTDRCPALPRPE